MPPPLRVTLYSRPGCHLCEQAAAMLREIGRSLPLLVDEIDIESDDRLLQRYLIEIPVIVVAGEEIARAPIRRAALERRLREIVRR